MEVGRWAAGLASELGDTALGIVSTSFESGLARSPSPRVAGKGTCCWDVLARSCFLFVFCFPSLLGRNHFIQEQ